MSRGSRVTPCKPTWPGEIDATIEAYLPAVDRHPPEPELVEPRRAEDSSVTGGYIERVGAERAAETGHERFLERARPEGLKFVCIERAEAAEQLIAVAKPVIEPNAELIDVPCELLDRREVLELGARRRMRHLGEESGERLDRFDRRESDCSQMACTRRLSEWFADRKWE